MSATSATVAPAVPNPVDVFTKSKPASFAIRQANMDPTAKAVALTGVAVGGAVYRAAVNTADTRTWEILPKEFQLTQLPMPADRQVTVELPGIAAQTVKIPEQSRSAILLVSAPNPNNVTCHILPMTHQ